MPASNPGGNRLIHEKSPYLLQHAQNPVDWYPWGEEAFQKAKDEDKPVFLSIGYSTCHWCHVMAHESFEDPEVATLINRDFVAVKVDKEERPDIDGVYMRACQLMTGGGGWPTTLVLDAEGKPFFAGTYFPKAVLMNLLRRIGLLWQNDRESLLENGAQVTAALAGDEGFFGDAEEAPTREAVEQYRRGFDRQWGGFGPAPKFPAAHNLMFLLRTAPELAEKTLHAMYRGGIFDHVGGGFSRYSTDRYWLVPHFEKMLYDNALLAMAYLQAYEQTGKPLYRDVARRVFDYLERELRDPSGGFHAAQDADTDGVEGKFYVFTPAELTQLLGEADGALFCACYGVTEEGNFEGRSIPNLLGIPKNAADASHLLPKVLEYRKNRAALHTDHKLLTGWNALAAASLAMGARILGSADDGRAARRTLDFLLDTLTEGDRLFAGSTDGRRLGPGYLDDYAYLIFALIQMHQADREERWLLNAEALTNRVAADFWDERAGGFFFSGKANEELIARPKETWDGATPSGNSVMAYNLRALSLLTGDELYEALLAPLRGFMNQKAAGHPSGYGFYLWASLPVKKVLCALGPEGLPPDFRIRSDWVFRRVHGPEYPLVNGKTTYYVCEDKTCLPPVNAL